ncbi:MAG TPA: DUF2934 domain-containing protein [bacterium]|nr:DUF2934 domain-containing protein [bacterium]
MRTGGCFAATLRQPTHSSPGRPRTWRSCPETDGGSCVRSAVTAPGVVPAGRRGSASPCLFRLLTQGGHQNASHARNRPVALVVVARSTRSAQGGSSVAKVPKSQTNRRARTTRRQAVEPRPTEEEIRVRAYRIYERRGASHGQDVDDWLAAERELRAVGDSEG